MRRNLLVAGAAALVLMASDARAIASADVQIGGVSVSQDSSGVNWASGFFGEAAYAGVDGLTIVEQFDYSITLHNDGLPATRTWDDTVGVQFPDAIYYARPATGYESVDFLFWFYQSPEVDPYITYQVDGLPDQQEFVVAPGQTINLSGTFTVTETLPPLFATGPYDFLQLDELAWVDSSGSAPVPEVPAAAMLLVGLALTWRRSR